MMTSRMSQPSAPNSLRRFFDRVVHRSFGDLALRDDPAADYVSDLLTRFARTETLYPAGALPSQRLPSVGAPLVGSQRARGAGDPRPARPAVLPPARHRMVARPAEDEAVLACLAALEAALAGAGALPDSLADVPPRTLEAALEALAKRRGAEALPLVCAVAERARAE